MDKNNDVQEGEIVDETEKSLKVQATNMLEDYLGAGRIADFSVIPSHMKLAMLQNVQMWKKYNPVKYKTYNGRRIPYLDHTFCKKSLNFVFNFRVSTELIGEDKFVEYDNPKKDSKSKYIYEAMVQRKCVVVFKDQEKEWSETVVVTSANKQYDNPATSKYSVLQGAESMVSTRLAKHFGIGADIAKKEDQAYKDIRKKDEKKGKDVVDRSY